MTNQATQRIDPPETAGTRLTDPTRIAQDTVVDLLRLDGTEWALLTHAWLTTLPCKPAADLSPSLCCALEVDLDRIAAIRQRPAIAI